MYNIERRGIAIIGISCRLPGVSCFEDFIKSLQNPHWPSPPRILEHAYEFDFDSFGICQAEAQYVDPQQRIFLECCRDASQRAGYDVCRYQEGTVGVYGGVGPNRQAYRSYSQNSVDSSAFGLAMLLGNEKDYLAARVAYHLNLRGPSITVQSACSSALTAIHVACQALESGECDMALAGGVSLLLPDDKEISSEAGSGAGVILLKPLANALQNGDVIHGVILSTAVNNDGRHRASFAAPAPEGQAELIAETLAVAGLSAYDISYIESHGSGTEFGDAAETVAFETVFGPKMPLFGRLQARIGRLDAAAGVLALIRTIAFLRSGQVPGEAFAVDHDGPRRVAVHSFGIGGANAHLIVGEAPPRENPIPSTGPEVLRLSANQPESLQILCRETADWLEGHPSYRLADVAYTLRVGRPDMKYSIAVRCSSLKEGVEKLRSASTGERFAEIPDALRIADEEAAMGTSRADRHEHRVELPSVPFDRKPCASGRNLVVSGHDPANLEGLVGQLWAKTLGLSEPPAADANFFSSGGNSLLAVQFIQSLNVALRCELPMRSLYQEPTPAGICRLFAPVKSRIQASKGARQGEVAIVGAEGRFPGAKNLEAFWELLREGREAIRFLDDDSNTGGSSSQHESRFIPAAANLDHIDQFDADYFGISPAEAQLMDPQIRLLLECSASALSNAGYVPSANDRIAIFAGGSPSGYMLNILTNPVASSTPSLQIAVCNDRDALATIISHRLNLCGPSVTVQTFCSTSLAAVHLARQSLLSGECDMALAGGVSLNLLSREGYYYQPGGIYSPDGHCRPFDAAATGTVFGEGCGIVVLKRLEDALSDGDQILAVIKGSAMNNDGGTKAGYTAPSLTGQTQVVLEALSNAGVEARSISYIEAHGTATALGDPIEVEALVRAFRASTDEKGFCGIGSVKSNIGHVDRAAGISSLLKVVLAMRHKQIPATLHYQSPNPDIDFEASPFFVNSSLQDWSAEGGPRRAGVTALGIGGTNVHLILEEPPQRPYFPSAARWHILPISGNSAKALEVVSQELATTLREQPKTLIADVAYTLQVGRQRRRMRRSIVCANVTEAQELLSGPAESLPLLEAPLTVFLFPGQDSQHIGMGRDLYRHSTLFRETFEQCLGFMGSALGEEIRCVVNHESMEGRLERTELIQPALFAVEYAIAQLLFRFDIKPHAMIGHSVGEFVAATLAEVMTLEDAVLLVSERGRLMQGLPPGEMLAVRCEESVVEPWLHEGVCIAAVNNPGTIVLSGPAEAIRQVQEECIRGGVATSLLPMSHAFHSAMMDPVLPEFRRLLDRIHLHPSRMRLYSNVTGQLMTEEQAQSRDYWTEHMRAPVRFADCLSNAANGGRTVFLDTGPGNALAGLARTYSPCVLSASPGSRQGYMPGDKHFLETLGKLWSIGVPLDWKPLDDGRRRRVNLPAYPFERTRHWITGRQTGRTLSFASGRSRGQTHYYLPIWKRAPHMEAAKRDVTTWIVFAREGDDRIVQTLSSRGHRSIRVYPGQQLVSLEPDCYRVNPGSKEQLRELFSAHQDFQIVYGWASAVRTCDQALEFGFHAPHAILQALGEGGCAETSISLITENVFSVTGDECLNPFPAMLLGISQVAPKEFESLSLRTIDLHHPVEMGSLADELENPSDQSIVALRGRYRWTPDYEECLKPPVSSPRLRERGTYWITGGTGGLGLSIARFLAQRYNARLLLTQRTPLPVRDEWDEMILQQPNSPVASVLTALTALEAEGAEILVCSADATDLASMHAAAAAARQRFGAIHGAIHAAGIAGGGILSLKTQEQAEAVIIPKMVGAVVLREVLAEDQLDFLSFCSSIAAVTGDFGQADYCAANSFLDALAHSLNGSGLAAQSINWGPWREVGMAVNTEVPAQWRQARENLLRHGINPAKGVEAFERCLSLSVPQVVVTGTELSDFVSAAESVNIASLKDAATGGLGSGTFQARPDRPRPVYENEAQQILASILEKTLCIEDIGLDDNLFHLGCNSLLALQMLPDLQAAFGNKIGSTHLFEHQTIRQLTDFLEQGLSHDSQDSVDRGAQARVQRGRRRERLQ